MRSPPRSLPRIALVGQPNCGKSTVFNHLVGYKAHTSNLPGTTVENLSSQALVDGTRVEIVDLPGTYSLSSLDDAEAETRRSLLTNPPDAILNIVDASLLSRSFELTYQMLELGIPTVLCLNMMDEARRKGISIDADALASHLEIPSYKVPSLRVVVLKVWLRVRGFLRHAMPILVVGSIVLELLSYWDVSSILNLLARPITWSLGLPAVLGIPLVFGVFRKELSLVMLFQALGTTQVAAVLTAAQMYVFAVFVIFYVPCIATVAVLRREFGTARTLAVVGGTTGVALVTALLLRGVWALF